MAANSREATRAKGLLLAGVGQQNRQKSHHEKTYPGRLDAGKKW